MLHSTLIPENHQKFPNGGILGRFWGTTEGRWLPGTLTGLSFSQGAYVLFSACLEPVAFDSVQQLLGDI